MNRKRTKAERDKFSATMREAAKRSWAKRRNGKVVEQSITYAEATNKPSVETLAERWNREANETFAGLPLFVKCQLLDGR